MINTLTEDCRYGYYGNSNPHIQTSPAWFAHRLGAWLHQTGRDIPASGVKMSRGYSIRVNQTVYKFDSDYKIKVAP